MTSYRPDADHYHISTMISLFFRPVLGGHGQLGKMLSLNTNVCSVYRANSDPNTLYSEKQPNSKLFRFVRNLMSIVPTMIAVTIV